MRLAANRCSAKTLVLLFGLTGRLCFAAAPTTLPDEASFVPSLMKFYVAPEYEPWNELLVPHYDGKLLSGKHWSVTGHREDLADSRAAWKVVKEAFLAHGWTMAKDDPRGGQMYETLHFAQKDNGAEAWANVTIADERHILIEILKPAPLPYILTLVAPGTVPEQIDPAKGEFPYLTGLPGSKLTGGALETAPFTVPVEGASQPEVVASGSIHKSYTAPDGFTNALFMAEYPAALKKAGWVIVRQSSSADSAILAHYSQQGRNVWAYLHLGGGRMDFSVADAGARDLGKTLSADCHVAIYGVLFDFNKATLQTASEPPLQQVLALLKKNTTLNIEVQGHTDNVGTDTYNQTLSESRAAAVVTWLTQHGIAAARLTSKGYGMTKPVADNRTDEGRAKNRRVEISDPRCVPKAK
jgi:outer membrane protein OmpA-like peptidoglycan-associated protein